VKLKPVLDIVVGALAFGLAHGFVTGSAFRATLTPDPLIRPWFTNSTGAVLVTAAIVAAAALVMAFGAGDRRGALQRGVTVGVGAAIAMLALWVRMGIGTLGPIAIAIGAAILLAAGAAGGGLAAAAKKQ
jgi:hypothetical protein